MDSDTRDTRYEHKKPKHLVRLKGHQEIVQVSDNVDSGLTKGVLYSLNKANRWKLTEDFRTDVNVTEVQKDGRRGRSSRQIKKPFSRIVGQEDLRKLDINKSDLILYSADKKSAHNTDKRISGCSCCTGHLKNERTKQRRGLEASCRDPFKL
eukprot:GILK01003738.1.p1 GENE.GILK01003738.1~~GILK01003738.1.p1  ORF type:complete len:152 (+),score=13.58 GILK01003738.1:47-502(+)